MSSRVETVRQSVVSLLSGDQSGHAEDHTLRVYDMAMRLNEKEKGNTEIIALAALLHDCDDYKLFGRENAKQLTNAKKIMNDAQVPAAIQKNVLTIIQTMGYSKLLEGIRPKTLEGKIVSDADMLDAIGALGTIRCLSYALHKCDGPLFDKNIWPTLDISAEAYQKAAEKPGNFINHFFEKLLKLKSLMLTAAGQEEAESRHQFMVFFLRQFFLENQVPEWQVFLEKFLRDYSDTSRQNEFSRIGK